MTTVINYSISNKYKNFTCVVKLCYINVYGDCNVKYVVLYVCNIGKEASSTQVCCSNSLLAAELNIAYTQLYTTMWELKSQFRLSKDFYFLVRNDKSFIEIETPSETLNLRRIQPCTNHKHVFICRKLRFNESLGSVKIK